MSFLRYFVMMNLISLDPATPADHRKQNLPIPYCSGGVVYLACNSIRNDVSHLIGGNSAILQRMGTS